VKLCFSLRSSEHFSIVVLHLLYQSVLFDHLKELKL
jgi:hypothetical protein